ncbi:ABC transporter ATP-binding protein [Amycolatopsis halotolerans]|uniref:ABC transporter ATP-binding protein n=1 Tax=Amycolatopsis halotolerans TaxID=330083 RepID=A0ABV7QBR6_9PSEU
MTTAPETVLSVRGLTVELRGNAGSLRPVDDVSFDLAKGSVLGVLGESGCGKSMLLRTLMGIEPPLAAVSGEVWTRGRNLVAMSPRERAETRGSWISMVFQNPMTALDPVYTVERQLVEPLRRHSGMDRRAARTRALELLELVQITDPKRRLKAYPFELSGGMRQRVAIAAALACGASVLLADEPTTALDVTVQARILALLNDVRAELGTSTVIVTHDVGVTAELADEVLVLYAGRTIESGTCREVLKNPRHPYTIGLLDANVRGGQRTRPAAIPGAPPNLALLPSGCSFAPRCRHAAALCRADDPPVRRFTHSHTARCVHAGASAAQGE